MPTCKHFGRCGGCSTLDVPLARAFARKRERVERLLAPFLRGVVVEGAAAPLHTSLHARTKILYPVQPDARVGLTAGIYARGTHEAVEIEECAVQDPALTEYGKGALEALRRCGLAPYDESTGSGFVRALQARLAASTGELLVGLVTKSGPFPGAEALATELAALAAGLRDARGHEVRVVGVLRNVNDAPGNALLGPSTQPLLGRDWQLERAQGLELRVSFASFAQTHRDAEELLYGPALALLGELAGLSVVDAYGGVGAFGLRAARAGARAVQIVEANPSAVRDACANVEANGFANVHAVRAPFADFTSATRTDLLIVDPPRAGLGAGGAGAALALAAPRLLHVACSPDSLARDLAALCAAGYAVRSCRVVDLFPFTEHVEVLTLLAQREL